MAFPNGYNASTNSLFFTGLQVRLFNFPLDETGTVQGAECEHYVDALLRVVRTVDIVVEVGTRACTPGSMKQSIRFLRRDIFQFKLLILKAPTVVYSKYQCSTGLALVASVAFPGYLT